MRFLVNVGFLFCGDENVLKFISSDDCCTILNILKVIELYALKE